MNSIPQPTIPSPQVKPKAKKPRKSKRNQIPGHPQFEAICERVGGDPTAKERVIVEAEDPQSAQKIRVNFYQWRKASIEELGEEFALDNHLHDIRVHIEPLRDTLTGEIKRNPRGQPIPTNRVVFLSIRDTRETKALVAAMPQLGVTL